MSPLQEPERTSLPLDIRLECVQSVSHDHCCFSSNVKCADAGTQTLCCNALSLLPSQYQFYSGLTYRAFSELVKVVESKVSIQFKRGINDAVLLTLMRLRLGLLHADLAFQFCISVSLAGKIFCTIVQVLADISRSHLVIWLSRETIQRSLPKTLKESAHKGTKCTEGHMQRPKKLYARAQT